MLSPPVRASNGASDIEPVTLTRSFPCRTLHLRRLRPPVRQRCRSPRAQSMVQHAGRGTVEESLQGQLRAQEPAQYPSQRLDRWFPNASRNCMLGSEAPQDVRCVSEALGSSRHVSPAKDELSFFSFCCFETRDSICSPSDAVKSARYVHICQIKTASTELQPFTVLRTELEPRFR